jgi:hypothetical protein
MPRQVHLSGDIGASIWTHDWSGSRHAARLGLRGAIYQISPLDPVALGAATGILAIASLAASIIPARRAANVLPMTALRNG